ncbi:MAG: ATP-grasp ribosomal peptide maturase [Haloechinothrix sp.]
MSAARSVLILTDRFDPTADRVVEQLNERGTPVFRCDVAEFPESLSVAAELGSSGWSGWLRTARRSLDLDAVSGIYYRRPTRFAFHPDMSANEQRWAAIQARMGFGGLLAAVGPWLNHPHRIGYAEYKPAALQAAVACGLRVPRTLVTNAPEKAREFVAEVGGRAVCKPFGGAGVTDTDGHHQVFAGIVTPDECATPSVGRTMHLFQQWVPKSYEVRLTVVDGQYFAARIDSASSAGYLDWRADYDSLTYTPIETPNTVRARVAALLDMLGLRFGALDFVVDPREEWWHLETKRGSRTRHRCRSRRPSPTRWKERRNDRARIPLGAAVRLGRRTCRQRPRDR